MARRFGFLLFFWLMRKTHTARVYVFGLCDCTTSDISVSDNVDRWQPKHRIWMTRVELAFHCILRFEHRISKMLRLTKMIRRFARQRNFYNFASIFKKAEEMMFYNSTSNYFYCQRSERCVCVSVVRFKIKHRRSWRPIETPVLSLISHWF